jgi:hypothetical protein
MRQEQRAKSEARLKAIEEERERVLQKIHTMDAAMANYNAANADGLTEEMDQATQAKWTAYFNLETDEFDV